MTDAKQRIEEKCERIRGLQSSRVEKPTLVYFDIIGIAWPIRCMLHLANVDYELIQISLREWIYEDDSGEQVLKACFRNGHVPLYVDREVHLNDSRLIMNHLAEAHGFMPEDRGGQIAVHEIIGHGYDAIFGYRGILPIIVRIGIAEDVLERRLSSFMGKGSWGLATNAFRLNLDAYATLLGAFAGESGFLTGDRLSIADLHAFNVLCNWYKAFDRVAFQDGYPQLDAYIRRIAAAPGVRAYIDQIQEASTWFPQPDIAMRLTSSAELEGLV